MLKELFELVSGATLAGVLAFPYAFSAALGSTAAIAIAAISFIGTVKLLRRLTSRKENA